MIRKAIINDKKKCIIHNVRGYSLQGTNGIGKENL